MFVNIYNVIQSILVGTYIIYVLHIYINAGE